MKYLVFGVLLYSSLYSVDSKFEMGEKLYNESCISCHGKDGTSNTKLRFIVSPRNLNKTILDEEQSYKIIKKGARYWGASADMMPSFESVYNEEQLRSIAYYISKEFNPNIEKKIDMLYAKSDVVPESKKPKMLKRGKKIYTRNCSWCHGLDAKGDGEASKNPELSIFPYNLTKTLLSDKQMFLYVKDGGMFWGTHKDDMPSWSRKYDDYTIKSIVKYLRKNFITTEKK